VTRHVKYRPPETLALLGKLHSIVYEIPSTQKVYAYNAKPGTLLFGVPPIEGDHCREMYALHPRTRRSARFRATDSMVRAVGLYERFAWKDADEFYNLRVPRFMRRPRLVGLVMKIRYLTEKHTPDLDERSRLVEALYDHDFVVEKEGTPPGVLIGSDYRGEPIVTGEKAYAACYQMSQDGGLYFPRGSWRVSERGIEYADAHDDAGGPEILKDLEVI
jgi:hypothetical protein